MGWGAGDDEGAAELALVLKDLRGENSVPSAMGSPPPAMDDWLLAPDPLASILAFHEKDREIAVHF